MNKREVTWTVSFDSLLEPDPYVDANEVMPCGMKKSPQHQFRGKEKN